MTDTGASTRTPGLRGRLPAETTPKIEHVGVFLVTPLPPPVYPIDVSGAVPAELLGMLGNGPDSTLTIVTPNGQGQPVGDCYFAGTVHKLKADAGQGHESESFPDSNETVDAYDVYDNHQDQGVQMSDAMQAWFNEGFKDSQGTVVIPPCEAFVRILPSQVDAAMAQFGAVLCGVNLTSDADQLFSEGLPWTTANGQTPNPNEGHVVVRVKSDGQIHVYSTWGAYQEATVEWSTACCEEAWCPVTQQMAANAGMNVPALLAAIKAMGGQVRTAPVPTPVPTQTPVPVPAGAPPVPGPIVAIEDVAQLIEHDAEVVVEEVEKVAEDVIDKIEKH
jgi:hypothetical protein